MLEIPTNLYKEQIDEFLERMQGAKSIKEDPLVEQVQHPCMDFDEPKDNEVEFLLDEENDYASLCQENSDHQEEDVRNEISNIFHDE